MYFKETSGKICIAVNLAVSRLSDITLIFRELSTADFQEYQALKKAGESDAEIYAKLSSRYVLQAEFGGQ